MNYNKSFLVTLGHNSSVIFYDCENSPIGYEEERLSNIKSDSAYPIKAFEKVLSHLTKEQIEGANVFISHWFDKSKLEDFPTKYFNHNHFAGLVLKYNLLVLKIEFDFTHHDAHMWSTKAFRDNFAFDFKGKMWSIVADGFGNRQEVVSIYKGEELIKRVYGYENSLGLLYQHATSFVGMKENQDEYKFLGYEVMIEEVLNAEQIKSLELRATDYASEFVEHCLMEKSIIRPITQDIIDFEKLKSTKDYNYSLFAEVLSKLDFIEQECISDAARAVVGFYVQQCLEQTMLRILDFYDIDNVSLSGGCFMNVKLNNIILNHIQGNICINPLCGDQGAAIGLFVNATDEKFNYTDLCWGMRDKAPKLDLMNTSGKIIVANTDEQFVDFVSTLLNDNMIVNIIQGNMEFGPRALCNTTTLALPTRPNVMYINKVNSRNEVMPMAPVILYDKAVELFGEDQIERVIGSHEFMIIALDVNASSVMNNFGVVHQKPCSVYYTARPQVVYDDANSNIVSILKNVNSDCLINTSFNTHGTPILFNVSDAIRDFEKQRKLDNENRLTLVILNKND